MESKLNVIKLLYSLLILLSAISDSSAQALLMERPVLSVWNYDHMMIVRESLKNGEILYRKPYQKLIREAEKFLSERATSVMDNPDEKVAKSKDKHDFISVGKYCWPNPNTSDGMPWIQRDGYINVENFKKDDAVRLDKMSNRVIKLCFTYFFSDDVQFAKKASELVQVWFIDPATRMNPNFTYAQVIPGNDNDMGHFPGIIFGRTFVNILAGLCLVQKSSAYTKNLDVGIKKWFAEYYAWLTTSDMGLKESRATNNHSIAYDEQLLAIALFSGDSAAQRRLIAEFYPKRIFKQVEPDGKMLRELARTRALGYSAYNVKHMLEICEMVEKANPSFYKIRSSDGRCIGVAIDYIAQYLGKKPEEFLPYKQIADWDKCMDDICWIVKWAAKYDPSKNYEGMFEKYSLGMADHINNLLY